MAWHYRWFAIPRAFSALPVLGMVWYRGYLTIGFIRREMSDPTTLPLYGALLGQAVVQTLAPGGPPLGVMGPGAVIGSRP